MLYFLLEKNIFAWIMAGIGILGAGGMLLYNFMYYRFVQKTSHLSELKDKWLTLWKKRNLMEHRMNLISWWVSFVSLVLMCVGGFLTQRVHNPQIPARWYVYLGVGISVGMLLLRQVLDFYCKEELLIESLADYMEEVKGERSQLGIREPLSREEQKGEEEAVVERIMNGIRESAASDGHFSSVLTQEEVQIMREIIREFM